VRRVLVKGTIVLEKYKIIEVVNSGGMSNIYKVIDNKLGKEWCLKEIIKSRTAESELEYRSLIQEANIMRYLDHPSIPRIVTIEDTGSSIFIIMDFVKGLDIRKTVEKDGKFSFERTVDVSKQICDVLIYLHSLENPIFYRDMKPSNVVLQEDGKVRVLDFGISLVLRGGDKIEEPLGTRGYAPPEQAKKGSNCDLRSDIYSFGMTMYYMLTGINPKTTKEKLKPISLASNEFNNDLDSIVYKCIDVDPDNRYQTAHELKEALLKCKKEEPEASKKSTPKIVATVVCAVAGVLGVILSLKTLFALILAVGGFVAIPLIWLKGKKQVKSIKREKFVKSRPTKEIDLLDLIPDNVVKEVEDKPLKNIYIVEEYTNLFD
jgi:serine/threonine-protein kinase